MRGWANMNLHCQMRILIGISRFVCFNSGFSGTNPLNSWTTRARLLPSSQWPFQRLLSPRWSTVWVLITEIFIPTSFSWYLSAYGAFYPSLLLPFNAIFRIHGSFHHPIVQRKEGWFSSLEPWTYWQTLSFLYIPLYGSGGYLLPIRNALLW